MFQKAQTIGRYGIHVYFLLKEFRSPPPLPQHSRPRGRPAQHRPFQVRQIFTLIGFAPENFSQIFDGYEFTPKIISQI